MVVWFDGVKYKVSDRKVTASEVPNLVGSLVWVEHVAYCWKGLFDDDVYTIIESNDCNSRYRYTIKNRHGSKRGVEVEKMLGTGVNLYYLERV